MAAARTKPRAKARRNLPSPLKRELTQIVESSTRLVVQTTVEATIQRTLLGMGVDISKPESIIEFQRDTTHLRRWRLFMESAPAKIAMALFVASLSVISGVSAVAIQHLFWTPKS